MKVKFIGLRELVDEISPVVERGLGHEKSAGLLADITIELDRTDSDDIEVDSVDTEFERRLTVHLKQLSSSRAVRLSGEGEFHEKRMTIRLPQGEELAVARAVVRAAFETSTGSEVSDKKRTGWKKFFFGALFALCLLPTGAEGQNSLIGARDSSTGAAVPNVGDTTNSALRVYCVGGTCTGGGGGGGTSLADRATFTFGTTNLTPIGGVFDDTPPSALTTGMVGAGRMTSRRALHVNLRDASGAEITSFPVTGTFWQATQPVSNAGTFAVQAAQSGTWVLGANSGVDIGDVTINNASLAVTGTFFQATQPVSIAATVATKELRAATPTQSTVAGSATSVSCLASNANRLGASIYNDSTADLYLKLGATASTSSFTVKIFQDGYFELPFNYTGVVDCIWSSATGNARITELAQ